MKTMHLFAGAGGGLLADLILGHKPIIAVEINKFCCDILRKRKEDGWFPNLYVWEGDIRVFDPSPWKEKVDCIHAGWPCQDISVAGSGKGIEGEKSGLWTEVVRVSRIIRPQYLFLENSPAIIHRGLDIVITDLAKLGYDAVWAVIPASAVGAPHRRARWWCLAVLANTGSRRCNKQKSWQMEQSWRTKAFCSGENVADSDIFRLQRARPQKQTTRVVRSSKSLANSNCNESQGLEQGAQKGKQGRQTGLYGRKRGASNWQWWTVESEVGRVANGVANRVDRIKALGNGQVPLQAATAFIVLWRLIHETQLNNHEV